MKIIAIPRNGIGNRLQMLASAYNLAKNLDAELIILWTEQAIFKASFADIFEKFPPATVIEGSGVEKISNFDLPLFTNFNSEENRITLRNLRVGDQLFMPKLRNLLKYSNSDTEIWIESGEKFSLNEGRNFQDSPDFRSTRLDFYNQLVFNKKILQGYKSISAETGPNYWAIHLRGTDRKSESISNHEIIKKVKLRRDDLRSAGTKVFVASDDAERGLDLAKSLIGEGYTVVFDRDKNRNRLSIEEAKESVVDWLGLVHAKIVVSFGGTTYSHEAVVAGNSFESRIYLGSSIQRQVIDKIRQEALFFKLYGKLPYTLIFTSR